MAKAPKSPRRSPRRRKVAASKSTTLARSSRTVAEDPGPRRKKSAVGRVTAAVVGVGSTAAVLTGLYEPAAKTALICGGADRWSVKVANDPDAMANKINLQTDKLFSVPEINQAIKPGPLDAGGRMAVEEKEYKIQGFLSYFKTEGDKDYHVVISTQPGVFAQGSTPATGQSMVVEFPNPNCFAGSHSTGPATSKLGQAIAEARANFEDHIRGLKHDQVITKSIPVTVTGVGFFDHYASNHAPTGHSIPYALPDGSGMAVLELHPVTEIVFNNDPDPDND